MTAAKQCLNRAKRFLANDEKASAYSNLEAAIIFAAKDDERSTRFKAQRMLRELTGFPLYSASQPVSGGS